jgi:asparagine synthase (glutamine-hydrolysing)
MPSIFGIISKKNFEQNASAVQETLSRLKHEKEYVAGTYSNQDLGIHAGWLNHPGSFSDCLPIKNESEDRHLLFVGENFSDKETVEDLRTKGHRFDSRNAGYLVHLHEELGEEKFLRALNGIYSGLLIDSSRKRVVLFNDRYGMHRMYYHVNKEAFVFSTEVKAILNIFPELKQINMQSLGEYFTCDCVLENRTFFNDIFLLPQGSSWSFSGDHNPERRQYFSLQDFESASPVEDDSSYQELKTTFHALLPKYFAATQPVAMSLTGGIDTRMILSCKDPAPGTLPCYTFGGTFRDCYDVRIARLLAEKCRQPFSVLPLGKDYLSHFPEYAEKSVYISEGALSAASSYELYLNRLARKIAPVRMTGNYGGEVLRNNGSFGASIPCESFFSPEFRKELHGAMATHRELTKGNTLSVLMGKRIPWQMNGRFMVEQSQLTVRTPFLDNNLVQFAYRLSKEKRSTNSENLRLIREGNPAIARIPTDRGISPVATPIVTSLLHFYREKTFKIEYLYNYGMPQWLARIDRHLMPVHLEKVLLGRHKFQHFRIWFRDQLADYIRDILLSEHSLNRPYLEKKFVRKAVESHTGGKGNYTTEIDKLLTMELFIRMLVER